MAVPKRLDRLFEEAGEVDAIVAFNDPLDPTFFWATGLHSGGTFEGSAVILRPGRAPTVLVYPLEETTAERSDNEVVVVRGREGLKHGLRRELEDASTIGVDHGRVSVKRLADAKKAVKGADFVNVGDAIARARMIKDPDEVDAIRAACRITDAIADDMEGIVAEAQTEAHVAAEIVRRILREGAKTSFDPIVAVGDGSAEPHYSPGPVKLHEGAFLVDMGAKLAGYCSDITRTYSLGEPSPYFEEMYATVDGALEAALAAIRPGTTAADVHEAAAEVIEDSQFKGRFIHSTGHGLGVEVHDPGRLYAGVDTVLEEGMVFTVEPGVYVPHEAGVRLEEDVLVTANGCERLTRAKRALRDLWE